MDDGDGVVTSTNGVELGVLRGPDIGRISRPDGVHVGLCARIRLRQRRHGDVRDCRLSFFSMKRIVFKKTEKKTATHERQVPRHEDGSAWRKTPGQAVSKKKVDTNPVNRQKISKSQDSTA